MESKGKDWQKLISEYDFTKDLKVDSFVDVKYLGEFWCVAQVIELKEGSVRIHYEGWGQKYDENIKIKSHKFAPFRRHTKGYTGQKNYAWRLFTMGAAEIQHVIDTVQKISDTDFKATTPDEFTQLVRGWLFVWTDYLMTNWEAKGDSRKSEAELIVKFCDITIRLICKWLKSLPKYYPLIIEAQANPDLYLVSLDHAIAMAYPELSQMLKTMFGLLSRSTTAFNNIMREINGGGGKKKKKNKGSASFDLQKANVAVFDVNEGYKGVISLAKMGCEEKISELRCPLTLLLDFIEPSAGALRHLKEEFSIPLIPEMLMPLNDRLGALSEFDIKEIKKATIEKVCYTIGYLRSTLEQSSTDDILIQIFGVAIQLIRCSYIKKKLLGINVIIEMLPKASKEKNKNKDTPNMEWKDTKQLLKVLEDHQLAEIILGENVHPELLRKTEDIFYFMLENEKFLPKQIELLWKCCIEKHEDIVRASLSVLTNLVKCMPYSLLHVLFGFIEKTVTFTEPLLEFLETYTNSVITLIIEKEKTLTLPGADAQKENVEIQESAIYRLFSLDLFWNLALDDSPAPGTIKNLAMNALIGILSKYQEIATVYVGKAISCIKNEQTVIRSIQLLKDIDFAAYTITQNQKKIVYYDLKGINATNRIILSAIRNCELYHEKVKKEMNSKLMSAQDVMNYDFGSGLIFSKQVKLYIDFLVYYCEKGKLSLSNEELIRLWNFYIKEGICEQHSNLLYLALMKEAKAVGLDDKFTLLQDKTAKIFFDEVLCNHSHWSIQKLTNVGFCFFKNFVIWANEKELPLCLSKVTFEKEAKSDSRTLLDNFIGLPTLWNVVFQAENPVIKENAREFLVKIIDQLCMKHKSKRGEITKGALEIALDHIKDLTNPQQTKAALSIIDAIIEKIECLKIEDVSPIYQTPPLAEFIIYTEVNGNPTTVLINEGLRMSNLKNLIAKTFKIHRSLIVLRGYISKIEYDDNHDYYLTNFKKDTDNKFLVETKKNDIPLNETPRHLLTNSSLFERLLDLLRAPNEDIVNEVWKLLQILPQNEEYAKKLTELNLSNYKEQSDVISEWTKYLGISPDYESTSLPYYLFIIKEMHRLKQEKDKAKKQEMDKARELYKENFAKKGGLQFFMSIIENKINAPRKKLNLKCLEFCIKIVRNHITPKNYSLIFPDPGSDRNFWYKMTSIAEWVASNHAKIDLNLDSETEGGLFLSCFSIQLAMTQITPSFADMIMKPDYLIILKEGLFNNPNDTIRNYAKEFLSYLLTKLFKESEEKKMKRELLNVLMLEFLKNTIEGGKKSATYFDLMEFLLDKIEDVDYDTLIKEHYVESLISQIINLKDSEKSQQDNEICFSGLIGILRLLLTKNKDMRTQVKDPVQLTSTLLKMLFPAGNELVRYKDEKLREKTLKFLSEFASFFAEAGLEMLKHLGDLHINGDWRTNYQADWAIQPGNNEKPGMYVGLKNLGATCYMNSSLQQLFMIPQFRKGILEADHKNKGKEDNSLFQLQLIFASLKMSLTTPYNSEGFAKVFKMHGAPINVFEQKDVDEFITSLLDHIDQELKETNHSRLIKNTFMLALTNEIICKDCPHRSETKEEAISVILNVKNKRSVYESLNSFVQSDTLEGDNAYYCERCDKKVAASKRQNIKTLPNVLLLVLKRFEFNLETLERIKVNDYCEFPHELDMEEFTQERLEYKDIISNLESGKLSREDLTDNQKRVLQRKVPKDYYKYKLRGIIVHSGYSDGGHYYSYIADRERTDLPEDKRWFEFNDAIVREFDSKDIASETYGGDEDSVSGSNKEKIRNAYVVIYERVIMLNEEQLETLSEREHEMDNSEISKLFEQANSNNSVAKLKNEKTLPELLKIVQQANKRINEIPRIFHPNYLSFAANLPMKILISEDKDYLKARNCVWTLNDPSIEPARFSMLFLLTVALRAERKDTICLLVNNIKDCCVKNIGFSLWICNLFSHPEVIQEFLSDCPMENARRWIAGIIKVAMQQVFQYEKEDIKRFTENPETLFKPELFLKEAGLANAAIDNNKIIICEEKHAIPYLIMMMNNFMQQINEINEVNCGQFFQVFCHFSHLGIEARKYLNQCMMLGMAFELLYSTRSKCDEAIKKQLVWIKIKDKINIGQTTKKNEQISVETVLKKKAQQHTFLFELIHSLLHSAIIPCINKKPNSEDEKMCVKLSDIEQKYIKDLQDAKVMDPLIAECEESKASLTYFSKIIAFLCFDCDEFTNVMFKYCINKLAAVECDKLKLYFRICFFLLSNQDKFVKKPLIFMQFMLKNFTRNEKHFRIIEEYIDFVIKICRSRSVFLKIIRQAKTPEIMQLLDEMEKWLKQYPWPSSNFPGVLFKSKPDLKIDSKSSEAFENTYMPLTDVRTAGIKKIKKPDAEFEPKENSDDDMYTNGIIIKEKAEYDILPLNASKWTTAVALRATDEVAEFEYKVGEGTKTEWIEIESNRLAPAHTMVKDDKWHISTSLDAYLAQK